MKSPIGIVASFGLMVVLGAQLGTAQTAADLERLRQEIASIRDSRKQSTSQILNNALREVQAAQNGSSDALRLYQDAYRTVELEGRGAEGKAYNEWRQQNAELLSSNAFQQALQFHLRWLGLAIERAKLDEAPTDLSAVRKYLDDLGGFLVSAKEELAAGPISKGARPLIDSPVQSGLIARYLGISDILAGVKDWPPAPGNHEVILNQAIRNTLRKEKSPSLIETWDFQIAFERAVSADDADFAKQTFESVRVPTLRWQKAQDLAALGQNTAAMSEMITLIRTYPQHPNIETWLDALDAMAVAEAAALKPTPSDSPSSAPPAPTPPANSP